MKKTVRKIAPVLLLTPTIACASWSVFVGPSYSGYLSIPSALAKSSTWAPGFELGLKGWNTTPSNWEFGGQLAYSYHEAINLALSSDTGSIQAQTVDLDFLVGKKFNKTSINALIGLSYSSNSVSYKDPLLGSGSYSDADISLNVGLQALYRMNSQLGLYAKWLVTSGVAYTEPQLVSNVEDNSPIYNAMSTISLGVDYKFA